jgi:hypothetical protein
MSTATTTATKALPSHYQSVMDDADDMGWDVVCSDTSVKLTPPGANVKKGQQIVLPLTNRWAPPQLQKVLSDRGFLSALAAHERAQGKADPKPEPEKQAPAQQDGKPVRVCPECEADPDVKDPFNTTHPPALAVHRSRKHGIAGTSPEAIRKRTATAAKKAAKKAPAKKTTPAPAKKAAADTAPVPAPRAAEPVKKQEPLVDLSGLPVSVAAPLSELLNAFKATSGDAADLEKDVTTLRDFRNQVDELVHDGNKAPVQVVASILNLVEETKQK